MTDRIIYGDNYQVTERASGWVENYKHCETTAFFMQYLARLAASSSENLNAIATAATNIAPKYQRTKLDFLNYSLRPFDFFNAAFFKGYMANPHMQISYYLLSAV